MFDNATADAAVFCVGLNGDKAAIITHALIPLVVRLSVKRLAAVKFHFFFGKNRVHFEIYKILSPDRIIFL